MSLPFEYDRLAPGEFGGTTPTTTDFEHARVAILPIPLDRTTSYVAGTRNGPHEILVASSHMELWDEETETDVHSIGIFTLPDVLARVAKGLAERLEADLRVRAHTEPGGALGAAIDRGVARTLERLDTLLLPGDLEPRTDSVLIVPTPELGSLPWSMLPSLSERSVAMVPSVSRWCSIRDQENSRATGAVTRASPARKASRVLANSRANAAAAGSRASIASTRAAAVAVSSPSTYACHICSRSLFMSAPCSHVPRLGVPRRRRGCAPAGTG